jgi:hypothetical protein
MELESSSPYHKCPPPVPILSQLHPVPTTSSNFLKIHLNIILPSTSWFSQRSLYLRLPYQHPVHTSILPHKRATCPANLIRLDFATRTILGKEYTSFSSLLRSFLHSPVTSSLLGSNTLLNTPKSDIKILKLYKIYCIKPFLHSTYLRVQLHVGFFYPTQDYVVEETNKKGREETSRKEMRGKYVEIIRRKFTQHNTKYRSYRGGKRQRSWLRHCSTSRKSRVRFPMVSPKFFTDIILPASLWPWDRNSL